MRNPWGSFPEYLREPLEGLFINVIVQIHHKSVLLKEWNIDIRGPEHFPVPDPAD